MGEIEVRQLFDVEDFVAGPAIQGFVELGLMERIAEDVQRTRPDLARAAAPNGTVTVLFTDIEASTELTETLGDLRWMEVLREHNAIVREQLASHSGFEVKSQGDGFMLAFSSARDALSCAVDIQRALAARALYGQELRIRIGLHDGRTDPRSGRLLRQGGGPGGSHRGGGTRVGDPGVLARARPHRELG